MSLLQEKKYLPFSPFNKGSAYVALWWCPTAVFTIVTGRGNVAQLIEVVEMLTGYVQETL